MRWGDSLGSRRPDRLHTSRLRHRGTVVDRPHGVGHHDAVPVLPPVTPLAVARSYGHEIDGGTARDPGPDPSDRSLPGALYATNRAPPDALAAARVTRLGPDVRERGLQDLGERRGEGGGGATGPAGSAAPGADQRAARRQREPRPDPRADPAAGDPGGGVLPRLPVGGRGEGRVDRALGDRGRLPGLDVRTGAAPDLEREDLLGAEGAQPVRDWAKRIRPVRQSRSFRRLCRDGDPDRPQLRLLAHGAQAVKKQMGTYGNLTGEASFRLRAIIWNRVVRELPNYLWVGSGLGTFEDSFAPHTPAGPANRWDRAHNDYLQLLWETGLAGGVLFLSGALIFGVRYWWPALRSFRQPLDLFRVGIAVSLMSIALHSLVDFCLQIGANGFLCALLAGLLVALHGRRADMAGDGRRAR